MHWVPFKTELVTAASCILLVSGPSWIQHEIQLFSYFMLAFPYSSISFIMSKHTFAFEDCNNLIRLKMSVLNVVDLDKYASALKNFIEKHLDCCCSNPFHEHLVYWMEGALKHPNWNLEHLTKLRGYQNYHPLPTFYCFSRVLTSLSNLILALLSSHFLSSSLMYRCLMT